MTFSLPVPSLLLRNLASSTSNGFPDTKLIRNKSGALLMKILEIITHS